MRESDNPERRRTPDWLNTRNGMCICVKKAISTYLLFLWAVSFAISLFHIVILASAPLVSDSYYSAMYNIERYWCHQDPERTHSVLGRQLPLCVRCSGLYTGVALSVLLVSLGQSSLSLDRKYFTILFVIVAVGLIDICLKTVGLDVPALWRAFSGLCIGAGCAGILTVIPLRVIPKYSSKISLEP